MTQALRICQQENEAKQAIIVTVRHQNNTFFLIIAIYVDKELNFRLLINCLYTDTVA